MRKLVSLRHLELGGCQCLYDIPGGLGQLSYLQTFIMGPNNSLSELKDLINLRGKFEIGPESLTTATPKEAEEANLKAKEYLQYLTLKLREYDVDDGNLELVLEALRPHANLKKLRILYSGVRLPTWMSSLPNLVEIVLYQCKGCKHLPKLENLPSLRALHLRELISVEYIDEEDYSSGNEDESSFSFLSSSSSSISLRGRGRGRGRRRREPTTFFPSLKRLYLKELPQLKGWWRSSKAQEDQPLVLPSFPCLRESEIFYCPKLTSMPLQPTVITLILDCVSDKLVQQQLLMLATPTVAMFSNLEELKICRIDDLVTLPEEAFQCLTSLRDLEISECPRLTSLYRGMRHLTALQSLEIRYCQVLDLSNGDDDGMHFQGLGNLTSLYIKHNPKLESLPAGLQKVTTLQRLSILNCEHLTSLPDWIGNLASLQQLSISNSRRLTSLPQGMRRLTALRKLKIDGCIQQLKKRCGKETGEDWPKIAHIPEVQISTTSYI